MLILLQIILLLLIFLTFYSYLLYPSLLLILAMIFKKDVKFDKQFFPTVGVVVPVYNEEKVILRKIENILSLDYPTDKLSIWIGSDQSTDHTNGIVSAYSDSRVHLWIAPQRGGKTEILNKLVPQVDSEIIFLTDANTIHKGDCLKNMVGYFTDATVGAVAGRVVHTIKGGKKEYAEAAYRSFEVWQKKLESRLHSSISAFGGFYTIRKEFFKLIPFNAYSNDDVLIPMNIIRQGRRVIFESKAVSEEDVSGSIRNEFLRRIRIGAGNFQAFFWLLDFFNPLKGWPSFCYISHKVIRWFSPMIILGCFISVGLLSRYYTFPIYYFLLICAGIILLIVIAYKLFRLKILRPPYYFLAMNVALFFGFLRYIAGIKSGVWSRTERQ